MMKKKISKLCESAGIKLVSYKNLKGGDGYRWVYIEIRIKDALPVELTQGYWAGQPESLYNAISTKITMAINSQ